MSKYAFRKKEEFTLSEEAATDQVILLLSHYDIDMERLTEGESKEEKAAASGLEKALDHVRDAIRRGVLEIGHDGNGKLTVTQTLSGGDTLTYAEIQARHKIAMEKFDQNAGYSRIYALMGSLAGVGKAGIEKLPAKDLSIVEVLGTVFILA